MRRFVTFHTVLRVLVVWVITAVTLYVLSRYIPGIDPPGSITDLAASFQP